MLVKSQLSIHQMFEGDCKIAYNEALKVLKIKISTYTETRYSKILIIVNKHLKKIVKIAYREVLKEISFNRIHLKFDSLKVHKMPYEYKLLKIKIQHSNQRIRNCCP